MMLYNIELVYENTPFDLEDKNKIYNREFVIDTLDLENNILEVTQEEFNVLNYSYQIMLNDNLYKIVSILLKQKAGKKSFLIKVRHHEHIEGDYLPF